MTQPQLLAFLTKKTCKDTAGLIMDIVARAEHRDKMSKVLFEMETIAHTWLDNFSHRIVYKNRDITYLQCTDWQGMNVQAILIVQWWGKKPMRKRIEDFMFDLKHTGRGPRLGRIGRFVRAVKRFKNKRQMLLVRSRELT